MSELLFKILGICLVAAALSITLKPQNGEYAFFTGIAAAAIVTVSLLLFIKPSIDAIKLRLEANGIETEYFKTALKSVGIGYITTFVADTCRDGGQTSLASRAEFAGKCAVFVLCCPLFISVLETAVEFIK